MFPPTHLLVKTCGGSFPVQKKLVMNEQRMSEHTHMPWMYNKLHFCLCNVYLDLKQRIRSSWKLSCFVAGLMAGGIHRQQAGMLPGGWDAEITRMARKRRDGHKVWRVLRQTWGRGRRGGIGLMAVRSKGTIMRRGWNRRGPTKGQKPRIQAAICVIPPWLDRDYLIGERSCLSDWLRLFWTEGVWAAKEFFGFRFSNSSDSLLAPVASLSPMLVFTSALLLPFLLFSSFDAFKFFYCLMQLCLRFAMFLCLLCSLMMFPYVRAQANRGHSVKLVAGFQETKWAAWKNLNSRPLVNDTLNYLLFHSFQDDCVHLGLWRAQRIGVIETTVAGSSPRNSRAVSREASNRLNNNIISSERFPNNDQDEFFVSSKGGCLHCELDGPVQY